MFNLLSLESFSQALIKNLNESLGIWYLIILNAFGVVAIIFKVVEYQLKSRKIILLFAVASFLCWIFYFLLQGDFVSALINLVCVIQLLVFLQREKYKWANSIWWMIGFFILQLILGILTFKNWHDVFAVLAGVSATVAYFVMNKRTYRLLSLFSVCNWVANSICKFYVVALLNDVFATLSVIVAIVRFDMLKRKEKKPETENMEGI